MIKSLDKALAEAGKNYRDGITTYDEFISIMLTHTIAACVEIANLPEEAKDFETFVSFNTAAN